MILNISDLINYTHRMAAAAHPDLRDGIILDGPGCSDAEIAFISDALPGIPPSYLSVVKSLMVNGVSIGYFQLSPSTNPNMVFVQKLIDCNDPDIVPMAKLFRYEGVYYVALWEADPIAVVYNSNQWRDGQVIKYNIGNPDMHPSLLAEEFTQFLILAGALDEVRDRYMDSPNLRAALADFESNFRAIVGSGRDDMKTTWQRIAEVVLD